MKNNSGILNDRYDIEDFYCVKHGTAMKFNTKKEYVLQKIEDDGLDQVAFVGKLIERTSQYKAEEWWDIESKNPFEDDGKIYQKYLEMMSKCSQCEQEATDAEKAKIGHKRCSMCNRYEDWEDFSVGCSVKTCPNNGSTNICLDCANESYCESCDDTYCTFCALDDRRHGCNGCGSFCCGEEGCNGTDDFIVYRCKLCSWKSCLDCEPWIRNCDICNDSYCNQCREVSFCGLCCNFYCIRCRHVAFCDNCDLSYCEECDKLSYCEDCEGTFCTNCH